MDHGGGMTWLPGTYDPELNLLYWGTGNANPVFAGQSRQGANLWTASIVALNPDTGKLAWYFQASPHDTHDWDNVETPVLFDAAIDGKPRKLLAQAARCGWFFVLDRTNGKNLVSKPFSGTGNWAKGVDAKGQPIPDPAKEPKVDGSMIDMPAMGATNWPPPSYDPQTELFYLNGTEGYGIAYLYDTSDKPEGYGGGGGGNFDSRSALFASIFARAHQVEARTRGRRVRRGGVVGRHSHYGRQAFVHWRFGKSGRVRSGDGEAALAPAAAIEVSNGPSTWMLDGKQYLIVGAGERCMR